MAEETNIEWCDSTFNPWWGCTKIGAGCDNCYAAALDKRTGGDHWAKGTDYRILSDSNWYKPLRWQKQAAQFYAQFERRRRVFCASMADVFDNRAQVSQRERLWAVVNDTPDLNWLLLTKRPKNIQRFMPEAMLTQDNIWLGTTVENRQDGLPRLRALKNTPAALRFLSIEPLLEDLGPLDLAGIDWVIVGGESGPGARPMKKKWMLNIKQQCDQQGVAFFFKQWGGRQNKGGCEVEGETYKRWPLSA
ncbi:DUF5131 family protein [Alteromonas macleodii]|uniref:Phage Gp37/Gp68 family protein n=1 Tax=Alteromonas macleodii TaxID=28108 RepID=A0AB36FKX3_ALTMA|nr:phage Gp37/Gp68 family protein [Alteromonas macleodii]OES24193.1 phage Gp37/Gp68 family protein [Alteromonas macleodii]OES24825.1 phage Gp37/Gp68 family protein [Alteromonas macleodii]OES25103.1 phage Gp37/Gp68 family protein [Alteromonas macleodii]OES39146.1 phage Gp37/Gp68 family protein [Alteromonas macleodii]